MNHAVWAEQISDATVRALRSRYYGELSYIDQCLSDILASSFMRIASKESDLNRVGYAYYVGPLLRVEHAAQAAD